MEIRGFLDVISAPRKEQGDYYDAEGFLVCGKCGTRKQTDIPCSAAIRASEVWRVPIPCRCEAEADRKIPKGSHRKIDALSGPDGAAAAVMACRKTRTVA